MSYMRVVRRQAVSVTLEPGLRQKLEAIAHRESRTLSRQVEQFLKAELKRYESENGPITPDKP